ncbi:MAG TPA: SusC/RagA family TonB-linked outer membrane protein [Gemmatimonadaceae bacterium]|nr:SusC/RagA family TonB-linked outer membrane protein [Gemmatimonadaceae bacterium]
MLRSMTRWSWILALVMFWSGTAASQEFASARSTGGHHAARQSHLLDLPARLSVKNVTIENAIRRLTTQSGVSIAFSPSLLDASALVTCACEQRSVGQALAILLAKTDLSFSEASGQVLIERTHAPAPDDPIVTTDTMPTEPSGGFQSGMGDGEVAFDASSADRALAGTITGQVLDSLQRRPIAGVQVYVVPVAGQGAASALGSVTGASGSYTITGVPAGEHVVRARLLGYAPAEQRVTVTDGAVATANFVLARQSVRLNQIIVTGTPGGTQRRAIGNVVGTINAADVLAVAPATDVDQLIGERTPGLIVLPSSGQVGAGAELRVRGTSSMSLSNAPIIYIDGIRMDASASEGPSQRGGMGASRLDDLNPEDIASIEVIKGPAAATLYGTEASNGVIQIITKRGATGKPQLDLTVRSGRNWMANPEERTGLRWAKDPKTGALSSFNVYRHEEQFGNGPVFHDGLNQGYNASLRGGTDAVRYFTSLSWDNDEGIVDWNWDKKLTARANMDLLINDKLKLQFSNEYIRSRIRLMQGGIDYDPFSQIIWSTPSTKDLPQRGFNSSPPESWDDVQTRADDDRLTTSMTANYQPVEWLTSRLIVGMDLNEENNWRLFPREPDGASSFFGSRGLGDKNVERGANNVLTVDFASSAKANLMHNLLSTSSVGFQYYRQSTNSITAEGQNFPAIPITTVSGGAERTGSEDYLANATLGVYFQEQFGWNNRLFLTGALRADDNSAFGAEFNAAIYPKLSAAWVLSEEPFWHVSWLSDLRLRAAWGAAGKQPGTFDAARLYDPSLGYQDQPALLPSAYGNPQLKPERGEELELGLDATLFNGRIDLTATRYQRVIKDAIVNRPLPPSTGFSGSQVVNIGKVKGWGNELGLNAHLVQHGWFAWDVGTQLATTENRIEDLGGLDFIGAGGQAQNRVGYSIADIFMYRIRSATLDSGGFVTQALCDGGTGPSGLDPGGPTVPCEDAPRVLWGHSQPTWQLGINTTFTLFHDLRLYIRADGNGGNYQSDTEIRAIHNLGESKAVIERNDPMLQAYRALDNDATGTYKAGFLRLREVSATYTLPASWAGKIGASGGSISLACRNLRMLWTAANGWHTSPDGMITVPIAGMHAWDPEIRGAGNLSSGFQTILPPTTSAELTVRLRF